MLPQDLAQRNSRFNEAIRGTQYEQNAAQYDQTSGYPRRSQFKLKSYKEIEKELDEFQRLELKKTAPIELQEKLDLIEKKKDSRFGNKIFLLHGPPGSAKSSMAKLIAYYVAGDYLFLKGLDLTDGVKNSARDYLNDIFTPLIENKKRAVIVFDELTALTSKFHNINDGDAGAVQHLWTTSDSCKSSPGIYIVATANEINDLPAPLRSRCKEYFIDLPTAESRFRILKNYLNSSLISEELLNNIAAKTKGFSMRDIETIIEETEDNYARRSDSQDPEQKIFSPIDLNNGFNKALNAFNKTKKTEKNERWKKLLKEYGPILIIPLFRMGCDYVIQYVHHNKQMAWNEKCYRENLRIQEHNHRENLELQEEHFQKQLQISHNNHKETLKNSDEHHQDYLNLQDDQRQISNLQYQSQLAGNMMGPVARNYITDLTGNPYYGMGAQMLVQMGIGVILNELTKPLRTKGTK
jgi:SpoVK/Ycf46/Vps4 family AAA+-type ATPase